MRLPVGWLCLSLVSVWLARRMWTLRSPLTCSLYVNMTSGPGGLAANIYQWVARKRLNVCVFTRSVSETA
uniref:Uncharacterized protein n=1 Tax=Callithrix jacchus TaxID=9483 RepID=A0A8I3XCK9_CALJA